MRRQLKKFFVLLTVIVFAINIATYANDLPKPKPPVEESSGEIDWEAEYSYGYYEGQSYASRGDGTGYNHMVQQYTYLKSLYPENYLFYDARLTGISHGYWDHIMHGNPPGNGGVEIENPLPNEP